MRSIFGLYRQIRLFSTLRDSSNKIISIRTLDTKEGTFNTPLLKEIHNLSKLCPGILSNYDIQIDHLLLVQVGSFYEIYEIPGNVTHDFNTIVHLLNLRIARKKIRNDFIKFAGFPMVKAKEYIELLIRNNITVALADQTGKDLSSKTKLFVRNITRIITPGTLLADDDFEVAENNFLLCIGLDDVKTEQYGDSRPIGLAWVDISTGEFYLNQTIVF